MLVGMTPLVSVDQTHHQSWHIAMPSGEGGNHPIYFAQWRTFQPGRHIFECSRGVGWAIAGSQPLVKVARTRSYDVAVGNRRFQHPPSYPHRVRTQGGRGTAAVGAFVENRETAGIGKLKAHRQVGTTRRSAGLDRTVRSSQPIATEDAHGRVAAIGAEHPLQRPRAAACSAGEISYLIGLDKFSRMNASALRSCRGASDRVPRPNASARLCGVFANSFASTNCW